MEKDLDKEKGAEDGWDDYTMRFFSKISPKKLARKKRQDQQQAANTALMNQFSYFVRQEEEQKENE